MLNIGPGELIVIALVLLIAVGPEQLPGLIRRIGHAVGQAKAMTDSLRSEFMSGLDEIERVADPNAWAASAGPSAVQPRAAVAKADDVDRDLDADADLDDDGADLAGGADLEGEAIEAGGDLDQSERRPSGAPASSNLIAEANAVRSTGADAASKGPATEGPPSETEAANGVEAGVADLELTKVTAEQLSAEIAARDRSARDGLDEPLAGAGGGPQPAPGEQPTGPSATTGRSHEVAGSTGGGEPADGDGDRRLEESA